MASPYRAPPTMRRPTNRTALPTQPGWYFWSEWKTVVDVYRKRGGKYLYVKPPGGIEVRITPYIAGTFQVTPEIDAS